MSHLLRYLRKEDGIAVLVIAFFMMIQVSFDLRIPEYMSEITELTQTIDSQGMGGIIHIGAKMMACAFASLLAALVVSFFVSRLTSGTAFHLRGLLFKKVQSFSLEEMNGFSTSSLITRTTNDVTKVKMIMVLGMQAMFKAPILVVFAMAKILEKSWQWAAATLVAIGLLLILVAIVFRMALPRFRRVQQLTDNLTSAGRESISGIRVVRGYNGEGYHTAKFAEANEELTENNRIASTVMCLVHPGMSLVMNGLNLAIYFIGAVLIMQAQGPDKLTIFSDMVVFLAYAMQVFMAVVLLAMVFAQYPKAQVSAVRIVEVLSKEPKIKDGATEEMNHDRKGRIEFNDVSFAYPDGEGRVLKNISFTAEPGRTTAIIGAIGSGKSTLTNLIPRLYDVSEGAILIDGINVKEYPLSSLQNKISYVPQKAVLFSGSIAKNLSLGEKQESVDLLEEALDLAQGKEFVDQMEQGIESTIAQRGTNLSGGQRQRLAMARAIARKGDIYLFDDSFSALDYKTDRTIRENLKQELTEGTIIIVGQRISSIKDADQIIVLDEGIMVGKGTHQELMEQCEIYAQIAYSQLSEEELR